MLFKILVQNSSPVDDEQSVRIVVSSRYSLQESFGDKLTHQDTGSTLDALSSIIGECHRFFVEGDTVTEDTEYCTRTHNVAIETFLLEVSIERNEK